MTALKSHARDYRLLSNQFFRLLPYQVLMLVINAANIIIDSVFASNSIGKAAMSAIGFYSPLDHFLYAVSITLVSGSQLLVGKSMGKNHLDSLQSIFSTDLIVSAVVSCCLSVLMVLASVTGLAGLFVEDAAELAAVNDYFMGMAPGIPALILGQQLFSFLSMENQTRRTTAASIACIALNTGMDLLLVSVLKAGTFGLGLASSVAEWTFFGVMAWFYFSGKSDIRFSRKTFRKKTAFAIIRQGYSGALSRFVEMFRCFVVNLLLIRYVASLGLSVFAAVNSVMAVFWPVPFGMMAVTRMMLGVSLGEEDRKSVSDIMRIGILRGGLLQVCITAFIILMAVPFSSLFWSAGDPAFEMTVTGFRIIPLCMPLSVFSLLFACYAQATDNKFLKIVLPVVDGAAGVVLFSLLLIPGMGMTGLWIANILNGLLCLTLIVSYAISKNRRAVRSLEDLLVFPENFGVPENDRMDIEIRQLSEVMSISGQVVDFCLQRGVDKRRAIYAGLAMEEMAGNIVSHGFAADKKSHCVNIRVVRKEDDIILRLRDDCIPFNPSERMRIIDNPEDPCGNIGLRIVYGLARDVRYQFLLGLNVLTVVM